MKNLFFLILGLVIATSCKNSNEETDFDEAKPQENKATKQAIQIPIQDSLAFELCQMYGLDQGIRNSPAMPNKWDFMLPIDSINFYKLLDITKKYGYPNKRLLGERNFAHECVATSAAVVLLHTPHMLVNNEAYLDIYLAEAEKDNLNINTLAMVLDKYYWIRYDEEGNRKLLYGSQFGKPCLKYRKESDSARARIGLPPLGKDDFITCF